MNGIDFDIIYFIQVKYIILSRYFVVKAIKMVILRFTLERGYRICNDHLKKNLIFPLIYLYLPFANVVYKSYFKVCLLLTHEN